jgi:AcrR family transcriptional regulator
VTNIPRNVKRRSYVSERRQEQAEQTRLRVLEAAGVLFVERGFDATSIAAIAERAGVSEETVYARFKTKRAVLGDVMQRAVRGDDPRPVPEQEGPRAVAAATGHDVQLKLFAADVTPRLERAAPMVAVVGAAARGNPELAELYERLQSDRIRNMGFLVDQLLQNGPLRLSRGKAVDAVWALTSPELHQLLRRVLGWSKTRYRDWLAATLIRQLVR